MGKLVWSVDMCEWIKTRIEGKSYSEINKEALLGEFREAFPDISVSYNKFQAKVWRLTNPKKQVESTKYRCYKSEEKQWFNDMLPLFVNGTEDIKSLTKLYADKFGRRRSKIAIAIRFRRMKRGMLIHTPEPAGKDSLLIAAHRVIDDLYNALQGTIDSQRKELDKYRKVKELLSEDK